MLTSIEITRTTLRAKVEAFIADPHRSTLADVVLALTDYLFLYYQRKPEDRS